MQRSFLVFLSVLFFSNEAIGDGYEHLLQLENFQTLGVRACEEKKVMVVMVSRKSCPYCIKLKKQIFVPEVIYGELNNSWLLRELRIDVGDIHIDFNGETVKSVDYARSVKATLTPTVLFLDQNGKEIGKRIVGIGGALEFYDFYLKKSIKQALKKLQCN